MNFQNRIVALFTVLIIISLHPVKAEQAIQHPVTPTEHISAVVNEVLPFLQNKGMDRELRWQNIWDVLHQHFDFRSLTQSVLARHWQTASGEEQHQITVFFSQYLEVVNRSTIEAYTEQHIDFLEEKINGKYAVVNAAITENSGSIPVTFQLYDQDGTWMVYDVISNGESFIDIYRATFNSIIQSEGMDGLINEISAKIKTHNTQH